MSSNQNEKDVQIRSQNMHQMCQHHMYYHVIVKTNDGQQTEGIITDLDKKNVYMLVPQDMMPADEQESPQTGTVQGTGQQAGQQQTIQQQGTPQQNQRQSYGPRYRRFYRQIFPLATLAALSLYPYYPPYPYPPYPYPYYPYPYPYY